MPVPEGKIFRELRGVADRVVLEKRNTDKNRIQFLGFGVIDIAFDREYGVKGIHKGALTQGGCHQTTGAGCPGSGGRYSPAAGEP